MPSFSILGHTINTMTNATDQIRAKGVLRRDLEQLRAEKEAAKQAAAAPVQVQAQPPAPMTIDLEALKPTGSAVPVAPMMATGGSPFIANRGIPKAEGKPAPLVAPVAPFPDMGMGMGAPSAAGPSPVVSPVFARAKAPVADQKRPSPKQPTPKQTPKPAPPKPSPKSNPPSARMGNKPSPLATHKQAPKPTASAPPAASAVAPAPMQVAAPPAPMQAPPPAAPVAPVAATQAPPAPMPTMSGGHNTFTNATFTVDATNNDQLMQNMDLTAFDIESFGADGPGDPANMGDGLDEGNDATMSDLDHFFDLTGDSNDNADDSTFTNMGDYISDEFANFDNY